MTNHGGFEFDRAVDELVEKTCASPALSASKYDLEAYSLSRSKMDVRRTFFEKKGIQRQFWEYIKDISDPSQRYTALSSLSLKHIAKATKSLAEQALQKGACDEATLKLAFDAAVSCCDTRSLRATHQTTYDSGVDSHRVEGHEDIIKKEKMLKAPYYINGVSAASFETAIFLNIEHESAQELSSPKSTCISFNDLSKIIPRSVILLSHQTNGMDGERVAVGGNHVPSAWALSTLCSFLRARLYNKKSVNLLETKDCVGMHAAATVNLDMELLVPRELSLIGHQWHKNGETTTITRSDRRSIHPDSGDLERSGRRPGGK